MMGALLRNELGATNGLLDASVISIKDTVTNLNNAVDQFYNELSNVANIHATVSNIADAVSFVSGSLRYGASFSDDRLSQLVDEFSLDDALLSDEANFMDLTVSQALSVLKAVNATDIPNISISDEYINLTAVDASTVDDNPGLGSSSIPSILENPYVVSNGTTVSFTFKDVHAKDILLTEAIELNTNYPNVDFSYSLAEGPMPMPPFLDPTNLQLKI